MANFYNIITDIPNDKGLTIRRSGNYNYLYKYTKHYRKNGVPRHKSLLLGRLTDDGKLIPNNNYFNHYGITPNYSNSETVNYGATFAIEQTALDIGLTEVLEETLPTEIVKAVETIIEYMIIDGGAMADLSDWRVRNRTIHSSDDINLTSQKISKILQSITSEQIQRFFEKWIAKNLIKGESTLCYDVTSISSYSKNITDVEYGYNRDGEKLPQINVGVFTDGFNKLPIYYEKYNGSLSDKTNLIYLLQNAKGAGISDVDLTLDGGFWWRECFKNLDELMLSFTTKLSINSAKVAKNFYLKNRNTIKSPYNWCKSFAGIHAVEQSMEVACVYGRVILYYDEKLQYEKMESLQNDIDKLESELACAKKMPTDLTKYNKYFIIEPADNAQKFTYKWDGDKIQTLYDKLGFFILFTTNMKRTREQVLENYRRKDCVEKIYDMLKNDINFSRLRTHTNETTDSKLFIGFLATIIRAQMFERLKEKLHSTSKSLNTIYEKLSNIQVEINQDHVRLKKALTKEQKEILNLLNIQTELDKRIKK